MKATITFDPERLQKAVEEEIGEHHRHSSSGRCQCNRSITKDPTKMREHLAAELMAVILRFQGDVEPESEEALVAKWRNAVGEHLTRLRAEHRAMAPRHRQNAIVVVPAYWPADIFGPSATMLGMPVRRGDVSRPEVHRNDNSPLLVV